MYIYKQFNNISNASSVRLCVSLALDQLCVDEETDKEIVLIQVECAFV